MEDLLVDWKQWIVVDLGMKPTGMSQDDWDKIRNKGGECNTIMHIRLCVVERIS